MTTENPDKAVIVDGEHSTPLTVNFPSLNPFVLKDLESDSAATETIETTGELFLPEAVSSGGPGERPGVVIVQGLGGQKPERELTYGHKLAKAGYAALALDSFRARGLADADDKRKALQVTTWSILADVFSALRFLADHEHVDANAISVMGFSWGGMATMLAAYEQIRRAYLQDSDLRFAGHIAYYGCSIPRLEVPQTTGAPVLILVGKHDENVSIERTRSICQDMRRGGSDVELKVLDGYHQWDGKDTQKRHVFGSLADLHITITKENELLEESWNAEIGGMVSQALLLLRDLRWDGYDIKRDDALHRETDALLMEFLTKVAQREGSVAPDKSAVALGQIGEPLNGSQ